MWINIWSSSIFSRSPTTLAETSTKHNCRWFWSIIPSGLITPSNLLLIAWFSVHFLYNLGAWQHFLRNGFLTIIFIFIPYIQIQFVISISCVAEATLHTTFARTHARMLSVTDQQHERTWTAVQDCRDRTWTQLCSPLTALWEGSKQETQSKKTHYLVVRMHRTEENTAGTRGIKLNTHSTGSYHNKAGISHWDTDQDIQTETDDKQRVKTEGIEWPKWKHDNHRDRTNTGIWMGKEIKEHYITNRGYNKRYKGQLQP